MMTAVGRCVTLSALNVARHPSNDIKWKREYHICLLLFAYFCRWVIFVVILAANIKLRQNCKEYATDVVKVSKILRLSAILTAVSVVRQCRPTVWAISGNGSPVPTLISCSNGDWLGVSLHSCIGLYRSSRVIVSNSADCQPIWQFVR